MIYAYAHNSISALTAQPIEILPGAPCHSLKSATSQPPGITREVVAKEYRFPAHLHFPKGQVPPYGLTRHLWENTEWCPPVQRHKIWTIKRQQMTEAALFRSDPNIGGRARRMFGLYSMQRLDDEHYFHSSIRHVSKAVSSYIPYF